MNSIEGVQFDYTEGKNPPKDSEKIPEQEVKVLTLEEIEEYRAKGQEMIDSYRKLFTTFAKDVSLKFKLSNAYFINYENGEVNMDTSWFAEREMNMDQILWATLHELSHFRDHSEDPGGTILRFEHIRAKTKELATKVCEKYIDAGVIDPETLDRITKRPPPKDGKEALTPVEQSVYKIRHSFYNSLNDIYVNNIVSRKAPKFEEKRNGGKEVKKLYKNKLFVDSDYSKLPRHMQFTNSILRNEMVKDEEVQLSDEVNEVFKRKIEFEGKMYTVNEIIEKFLKPRSGRNTKASTRLNIIRKTLEPIFDELLKKDLDEWDPSKSDEQEQQEVQSEEGSGESEEGEGDSQEAPGKDKNAQEEKSDDEDGEDSTNESQKNKDKKEKGKSGKKAGDKPEEFDPNPFGEDYKKFDENNPDRISEEEIEKWVDKFNEEKQLKDEVQAKTEKKGEGKVRAEQIQEEMDKEWAKKNNVDTRTLEEFRRLESEVAPYLDQLSRLWRDIVMGSSREITRGKEGYFPTGDISISKVIEDWPKISKREFDDVRVMERMVDKENLVQRPELIRVRIVGDMSGSMFQPGGVDSPKLHILRQAFVLILSSLKEFDTYLNMNRQNTRSKLEVDTEAWVFGSNHYKVKKLRSESGINEEQARIVDTLSHMRDNLSSTYDNYVLKKINDSISQADKERIEKGKIMEIVLEITDGVPNEPDFTNEEINKLSELGVIVRGFQIGAVSQDDIEVFNTVWNSGDKKRGEVVGANIQNLIPAITTALKEYLKNVRL